QFRAGLLGAAAAILLLAGGVVAFRAAGAPPAQVAASAELVPTGLVPDLEGSIEVTPVRSGLRVDLDAPTLPRRDGGRYYEGWLQLDDGFLVPIGTFHEGADVTLWAGIELDRVVGMTITLERAAVGSSPDQASSGEVVLKADIVADT
ncbi:MAG: anti-sigma factor, partial [Actinomycetota bacterium]